MSSTSLRVFIDKALSIKPPPGWIAVTSGSDVIYRLRKQTILFAQSYEDNSISKSELITFAQELEGVLLTLQVVSPSEKQMTNKLIDNLHALMNERDT